MPNAHSVHKHRAKGLGPQLRLPALQGVVAHTYDPSTRVAKAEGLRISGQPGYKVRSPSLRRERVGREKDPLLLTDARVVSSYP